MIEVVTAPTNLALTQLATVKTELGISGSGDDALLESLVYEASNRVELRIGRPLTRASYRESFKGSYTRRYTVRRIPVVALTSVTLDDGAQTLADFQIEDRDAGFIDSEGGWKWSDDPIGWEVVFSAGYFVPDDDVIGQSISVDAADDSFNSAGALFPQHLVPGDIIHASDFTDAANNGYHNVVTATTSKITTDSTLVNENAASRTITVRNLPGAFERAVIDLVKNSYQHRKSPHDVASIKSGEVEVRWSGDGAAAESRILDSIMGYGELV